MSALLPADVLDEFWDYEHQVDLEAFSSTTFYNILLKQSLSVTTRLGQLTAEVCNVKKVVVVVDVFHGGGGPIAGLTTVRRLWQPIVVYKQWQTKITLFFPGEILMMQ